VWIIILSTIKLAKYLLKILIIMNVNIEMHDEVQMEEENDTIPDETT
jgi:hypothetical protein